MPHASIYFPPTLWAKLKGKNNRSKIVQDALEQYFGIEAKQ